MKPNTRGGTRNKVVWNSDCNILNEYKCLSCQGSPCYWNQYGCEIIQKNEEYISDDDRKEEVRNKIRKKA